MAINVSYSTPANGTTAIYSLITLLIANGWTVSAWTSGVGNAAVNGVAVGNPYTDNANATTGLGNISAWFRITSPTVGGYTREWMFQRGADDYTWSVSRSRLGFTTGGTATVIPTDATSGMALFPSGNLFDAVLSSRLFLSVDTVSGAWGAFTIVSGGGNVRTMIFDEALAASTYPALDADPYICAVYYNATGLDVGAFGVGIPVTVYKRTRHGLTSPSNAAVTVRQSSIYVGDAIYAPASSSGGQIGPEPYGSTEVPFPIPVFRPGAASTSNGWCGYTAGLRWATVWGRSNGQTLSDGTSYWIYAGGMWVPWDSTTPVI